MPVKKKRLRQHSNETSINVIKERYIPQNPHAHKYRISKTNVNTVYISRQAVQ